MNIVSLFDDSNGVLQPYKKLGWWKWMYRVSPYTYVVEGIVGQGKAFVLGPTTYFGIHIVLFQRLGALRSHAQA